MNVSLISKIMGTKSTPFLLTSSSIALFKNSVFNAIWYCDRATQSVRDIGLLAFALILFACGGAWAQDSLYIRLSPDYQSARAGDTVTFEVRTSPISGLYAAGLDLNYPSNFLKVVSLTEGSLLNSGGTVNTIFAKSVDSAKGLIILGVSRSNYASGTASSSSEAVLFVTKFLVPATGNHNLEIPQSALIGHDGITRYEHFAYGATIDATTTSVDNSDVFVAVADGMRLLPAFPNPFNTATLITFDIDHIGDVELTIVNILGEIVAQPVHRVLATGRHEIEWNGCNREGRILSSGVYFACLKYGGTVVSNRLVLLK